MAVNFDTIRTEFRKLPLSDRIKTLNLLIAVERGRTDTEFFAEYFLGVKCNPFQRRLFREIDDRINNGERAHGLVPAGNRTGKTLGIALLMIKFAFYKIGASGGDGFEKFRYNVFDISPKSRQAKQCLQYIDQILTGRFTWIEGDKRVSNNNGLRLKDFIVGSNESIGRIEFANNSYAHAIGTGADKGEALAGLAAGIIIYDECVMSHHLRDELVGNIYSRLGDYGRALLLVATPNEEAKSQQYFYHMIKEAQAGESDYFVVSGNFLENIFIEQSQREQHVRLVKSQDEVKARQVIYGDFVVTGGVMFDPVVVENMWNGRKEPTPPIAGHTYLVSVDWGVSDQGDPTVMMVIDYTMDQWEVVQAVHKKGGDPWELMAKLNSIHHDYNHAKVIMDTASLGGVVFKKMLKDLKPISFNGHAEGGKIKHQAQTFLQLAMTKGRKVRKMGDKLVDVNENFGLVRSYYLPLLEEQLSQYRADDQKLEQDWVVSLYQGIWYLYKKFHNNIEQKKAHKISYFRSRQN